LRVCGGFGFMGEHIQHVHRSADPFSSSKTAQAEFVPACAACGLCLWLGIGLRARRFAAACLRAGLYCRAGARHATRNPARGKAQARGFVFGGVPLPSSLHG